MPHSFHHVRAHHLKQKGLKRETRFGKEINKLIYVAAIGGPLMTVPQLLKIWMGKDATGVSAFSWAAFLVLNLFWFSYGVIHRDKPILVSSLAYMLFEIFIVLGALLY